MDANIDLPKIMLLFYLIIASNYTKHLYSGQMHTFIKGNKITQHFIGILTIFLLITLYQTVTINIPKVFFYSVLIYTWFVFSTKLDAQWNLIIIFLLVINYCYNLYLEKEDLEIEKDTNIEYMLKANIFQKHNKNKKLTLGLILGVTGLGSLLYMFKKSNQYGGNFDINKFILD